MLIQPPTREANRELSALFTQATLRPHRMRE